MENKTDQSQLKLVTFDKIENVHARLPDINAANNVGMCLLDVLENLSRATEAMSNSKVIYKNVRQLLSDNDQVLEIFFMVNIILKGFLLFIEGDEWDEVVADNESHVYPPPAAEFLQKVYRTNFKDAKPVEPKSPIKLVNSE